MTEQNDNDEEIFAETVLAKFKRQDEQSGLQEKRITAIEGKLNTPQAKFPEEKMQELNKRLDNVLATLQHPPKSEVRHIYHFPAILWAATGLFLSLCLVSTGWFMTGQRAEQFRENDFKYRYLKVFLDSPATEYLLRLDSTYTANPDSFKNAVLNRERLREQRLELLDQIHSVDSQYKAGQAGADEKKKVSR
jgi:hypothetical protein